MSFSFSNTGFCKYDAIKITKLLIGQFKTIYIRKVIRNII